jgi:sec-independent protein translocase protein TatA
MTNPVHIALVVLALLLVFGAKRLPEMGRSLGAGLREFKDSIGGSPDAHALLPQTAHERDRDDR